MNKYAESLLPYVNNPNVRKVLDFISTAEGADYDTGFGGSGADEGKRSVG